MSVVVVLVLSISAEAQRGFVARPLIGGLPIANPKLPQQFHSPITVPCCRGRDPASGEVLLRSRRSDGPVIVPYIVPYPVYVGGGADFVDPSQAEANDPSDSLYSPQSPSISDAARVREPIISQMPAGQHVNDGEQSASPERACPALSAREDELDRFQVFIALKDSKVYTALAYWVQGETLHYITPDGIHNQVSLELVDRRISARLNAGRLVELMLAP